MGWHKPAARRVGKWFKAAARKVYGFHDPVPSKVYGWHDPVPSVPGVWHPGRPSKPYDGKSGFPAWGGYAALSEDNYLQIPGGVGSDGLAAGPLDGIGPTIWVVMKLAQWGRGAQNTGTRRLVNVTATDNASNGSGPRLSSIRQADGSNNIVATSWAVEGYQGDIAKGDPGVGPACIATGSNADDSWGLKASSCHVTATDQTATPSNTALSGYQDVRLGYFAGGDPRPGMAMVSVTVLTVEPTAAELNAYSLKGAMAWDVWAAADIYTHYHVANLYDAGAQWNIAPWEGQAGPAVDMVMGSAITDANLVEWTEPEIAWPEVPMALATGDLVSGAGVRSLQTTQGRTIGGAAGAATEVWAKLTRSVDSATSNAFVFTTDSPTTAAHLMRLRNQLGGAFPASTSVTDGSSVAGAAGGLGVAGDWLSTTVGALGAGYDTVAVSRNSYNSGVKGAASTLTWANEQADRVTFCATNANTVVANSVIQEGVVLTRLSVGDEWLTYSNNVNVDPRLIWGPDCQHVWSLAYFNVTDQSVPDIVDSASALDALDLQGTAATATDIVVIDANGEPI